MPDPTVDVVIPLHNKAPYVEDAIRSVQAQTYPATAIWVADDASTDEGPQIVARLAEADPRIHLLPSPHDAPRGASNARNRGIAAGNAELVAFLDADDYWDPGKLEAQIALLRDPAIGTVHCGARLVDAEGKLNYVTPAPVPPPAHRLFDEIRLGRYSVTGSASGVVTRRALLDAAGPFPEGVAFGEDWDMWSRLAALSGFVAVPELLTNIRMLRTMSRTVPQPDIFIMWLRVFDRWQDDEAFMRRAVWEARSLGARHQAGMIFTPRRMFVEFPRKVATEGGAVGRRIYGSPGAYALTVATMLPVLIWRILRKIGRETQQAVRPRTTAQ